MFRLCLLNETLNVLFSSEVRTLVASLTEILVNGAHAPPSRPDPLATEADLGGVGEKKLVRQGKYTNTSKNTNTRLTHQQRHWLIAKGMEPKIKVPESPPRTLLVLYNMYYKRLISGNAHFKARST